MSFVLRLLFMQPCSLLSFGGVEVSTADDLKAALASHSVGDRVEIKVSRNGREYTHSVVLTEYVPSSATN